MSKAGKHAIKKFIISASEDFKKACRQGDQAVKSLLGRLNKFKNLTKNLKQVNMGFEYLMVLWLSQVKMKLTSDPNPQGDYLMLNICVRQVLQNWNPSGRLLIDKPLAIFLP